MNLAPIVLFVYNRPSHTRKTLEALMDNDLAELSVLYIYCDGPKVESSKDEIERINEVRSVVNSKQWCHNVVVIEKQENIGLANSIKLGVTEVVNKHGNVIVLEDDIVTSSGFLKFMNDALTFYKSNEKVMHISGYMYPNNEVLPDTFFYNVPLCWGWATWKNCWDFFIDDSKYLWNKIQEKELLADFDKFGSNYLSSQLANNISGKLNTWFIKWHASVLLKGGYTLYPKMSLVDNIGFDNTGVHNSYHPEFKNSTLAASIYVNKIDLIQNKKADRIIKTFYSNLLNSGVIKKKFSVKKFIKRIIRKNFFKFFPDLRKNQEPKSHIENCYLGMNVRVYPKSSLIKSIVGNYTYIATNAKISNTIIGKYCSIGPNLISGWGSHPINGISTHPMFYSLKKQNGMTLSSINKFQETKPIEIGNDVFIGMNVIILDGVKIGDGAVIGAGAIVSKDIPPYAIALGNPIQIVKYRFSEDIVEKLLEKKWWDLEHEQLRLVEKHFFDIENYLKQ